MDETLEVDARGNRYPDSIKERAYQLWAFVCSRRPVKVSELLRSEEYGEPVDVTDRTIYTWAKDGAWHQRVSDDLKAIAPDIRQQTIVELVFGALDSARYLRAVVDGREEHPSKERVTSALGLLDKAGLSHTGTRADPIAGITATSAAAELPDVDTSDIRVLMQLEAELRRKKR